MKRSRITSYLGIISLGLGIIQGILMYFLDLDSNYINSIFLIPIFLVGVIVFPSIVCSYFELQVKKHTWDFSLNREPKPAGRALSLIYGIAFLLIGLLINIMSFIISKSIKSIEIGLSFILWIVIGILGITGAIIYRDTPKIFSTEEKLKRRKIGFTTVMICITILATTILILDINQPYYRTVNVVQDAYVYEYQPDTNYGQEDQIFVGNYDYGKAEAYYLYEISGFSTGWEDAYLEVKFDFASYPVNVAACIIYEGWDELGITWNNKPNHTTQYGSILCDGFSFSVPVKPKHFINNRITICLYGIGAESDGFLSGSSKEGALNDEDIPHAVLEYNGIEPNYFVAYIIAYVVVFAVSALYLKYAGRFSYPRPRPRTTIPIERLREHRLEELLMRRRGPPVPIERPERGVRLHPSELYKPRKIFKINELVDLRLIGNRTFLFVNNKRLMVCTFLLINIPKDRVHDYDEIKSIDEAAEILDKSLERVPPYFYKITPEEEFKAHCSNIQAFFENGLNTNILHTNIAFPLLKELVHQGFEPAQKVFKEEIAIRFNEGTFNSRRFLYLGGYLRFLNKEEKQALEGYEKFSKLVHETARPLMDAFERDGVFRNVEVRRRALRELRELHQRPRPLMSNFKIVIFGDANVGKNSISLDSITNVGEANPNFPIGVNFAVKTMVVNNRRIRLQIWRIANEPRFRFVVPNYFHGANGGLFIYDITNYSSLTNLVEWMVAIQTRFREEEIFPIIVVGNKTDLSNKREVPMEEAIKFAKSTGLANYIECSFKTGKNVEKMFERLVRLMLKKRTESQGD